MAKKKKAKRLESTKSTMNQSGRTQTSGRQGRKKKSDMRFKNMNVKQIFIFGAIALAMLAFILGPYIRNINSGKTTNKPNTTVTANNRPDPNIPEPQFRKDGELSFLSSDRKDTLQKIDIEIVKDETAIQQGLMYRKSMDENKGMLFVMPQMGPQSFWMKNTYIPLDIIFINRNRQIVTIQKNTTPFSEKSLPSSQNAQFIIEVNAGYCDKYGIKKGDYVKW